MKSQFLDLALFRDWLSEKKNLAESSSYVYLESVNRFLTSNPDVDSLEAYNDFIIKNSVKKRCYHYYAALRLFIEFKVQDTGVRARLIEGLIHPVLKKDVKQERKYLSEDEIIDVINHLESPKHRVIALIQELTGVRAGDIMRLKRDNIVPEVYNGRPTIRLNISGKGGKRNVVYVHDEVAQELIMDYISTVYNFDDYYFIELGKMKGRHGQLESPFRMFRMNYVWYWADLKQALQSCGVKREDFASHDFRRCFARRVWSKYKDIHVLQGLLNHSNPAVTLRYLEMSGLKNVDYHYAMQMGDEKETK
jgi:integrase